jgi:hypothetical protein
MAVVSPIFERKVSTTPLPRFGVLSGCRGEELMAVRRLARQRRGERLPILRRAQVGQP